MGSWKVKMFGVPEVHFQDEKIFFPFAKAEGLFYYLLMKKKASRDELATLLWGESDDVSAKKNLRNAVYLLRKIFGDEFLLVPTRNIIILNPAFPLECDVEQFLNDEGSAQIDLYSGEFLSEFFLKDAEGFEAWLIGQREYLRELFIARLKKLIAALLREKNTAEALYYLKCLLKADEYNEVACRALMKVYERERAFHKAIRLYNSFKDKLDKDLGIKPDDETVQIYNRIWNYKADMPDAEAASSNKFWGRTEELAVLSQYFKRFLQNSSALFLAVVGETGVGKTALVERLFETGNFGDAIVLKTYCYQIEQASSLKSFGPLLRQLTEGVLSPGIKLPTLWVQTLLAVFPALADEPLFENIEQSVNFTMENSFVREVIISILKKAANGRKTIIFIDDLQWADIDSLLLLKELILKNPEDFMIISTCRNEYLQEINAEMTSLERHEKFKYLTLPPFGLEEVKEFAAFMLPPERILPELTETLFYRTEGNALFLVEYFNLIKDGLDINAISSRIQAVLKDRVMSVSQPSQNVLSLAAFFVKEVDFEDLMAMCNLNEFELLKIIEELQTKNLLVEVPERSRNKNLYKFSHSLVQDFVYSELSFSRRKLLHNKIGLLMESKLRNDLRDRDLYGALVYHFSNSGNRMKVLEYTIKLATEYSFVNQELFPLMTDEFLKGSGNLYLEQSRLTKLLQEIDGLITDINETEGNSEQLQRHEVAYLDMLGRSYIWQDEYRRGLKTIRRMIRLAEAIGCKEYVIKGYQQVVYYGIRKNSARIVKRFAGEIMETATKFNYKDCIGLAFRFLGVACFIEKDYPQAEEYYRRSIAAFVRLEDDNSKYTLGVAAAYNYIGDLRRFSGEFDQAIDYYEKAIGLCISKNIYKGLSVFYTNAGHVAFNMRDYPKAKKYFGEALAANERLGAQWGHSTLQGLLAVVAVREGLLAEGLVWLKKADSSAAWSKNPYHRGMLDRVKAELRHITDKDDQARRILADYLPMSAQEYLGRSKESLAKVGDIHETEDLELMFQSTVS